MSSAYLLRSAKDVQGAYNDVGTVIDAITATRSSDDTYSHMFDTMESLYEDVLPLPRRAGRQTLRSNHDCSTAKEYYRVAYFLPYIDHLVADLNRRFTQCPQLAKGECP